MMQSSHQFNNLLLGSQIDSNTKLYRGTRRHSDLNVGDILDYKYPTSWSLNYDTALAFIDPKGWFIMPELGEEYPVIFAP